MVWEFGCERGCAASAANSLAKLAFFNGLLAETLHGVYHAVEDFQLQVEAGDFEDFPVRRVGRRDLHHPHFVTQPRLVVDQQFEAGAVDRLRVVQVEHDLLLLQIAKVLMEGDGLIFVADSQRSRLEANIEAMHNLYENMESYGYDVETIPFVLQYNKRDLPDTMPVEELRSVLNPMGVQDYEAVAIEGEGVFQTLSAVSKTVVKTLS